MSSLQGVGLQFEETMTGWVGIGKKDYVEGRIAGQKESTSARMDMKIIIEVLDFFINISNHYARLEGVFTFDPLGGAFVIREGRFNLFSIDPASRVRQMTYSFLFTGGDGKAS